MSKEAMTLALDALQEVYWSSRSAKHDEAITALREALAEQPAQKRPQNCGTGYCSCIECVMEPAQQEPVAWPIETNNQVEALAKQCGWDNRRYMTPADYQIWCDRMREFVQLATPQAQPAPVQELEEYDAGLLAAAGGGGDVEWWWDYIRAELGRAYEHYQSQMTAPQAQPAQPLPGVVLRDGQPTLLRDRDIKTTDVRLCVIKENP